MPALSLTYRPMGTWIMRLIMAASLMVCGTVVSMAREPVSGGGMPVQAYMGLERVKIMAEVGGTPSPALSTEALAAAALHVLTTALGPKSRFAVTVIPAGSAEQFDPDALVLVIAAGIADDQAHAALSLELRRHFASSDAFPAFGAAPVVVSLAAKARAAALDQAMLSLLTPSVIMPLKNLYRPPSP